MADFSGKNNAEINKEILRTKKLIERAEKSIVSESKKVLEFQEKLNARIVEAGKQLKANNQARLDGLASEEKALNSIGSIYKDLTNQQLEDIKLLQKKVSTGSIAEKQLFKISEINREIAQLGADDNLQRDALINKRNEEFGILKDTSELSQKDIEILTQQNKLALQYASMSSRQKDIIQKQYDILDGIKDTIEGTLMTARTLYGNLLGATGGLITGLGFVVDKIGKMNTELGTTMFQSDGVARRAALMNIFFKDAADSARTLSSELGGTDKVTGSLQAKVGIMAETMGISGREAGNLVGQFSRLNAGSTDVAANMMIQSREFAKQNNIIPNDLMSDLAASAEEFALFGQEGGENILRASGYAQKLGVNMKTLSGIAEGLLDFESSITKELELGALLGRNINLNKARQLAYENDIEGATKAVLQELGGITAFNRMDYFQKKATADLLGVSVAELQKMASNQESAANMTRVMGVEMGIVGEGLNYVANNAGGFLKSLGGGVTALGQMNLGFNALGTSVGGVVKGSIQFVKNLISANALTKAQKSLSDKQILAGFGGKKAKDMLTAKMASKTPKLPSSSAQNPTTSTMNSVGKINMSAVLKGAAAMLIVAAAMFVLAKALQEFTNVGEAELKSAGIALLGLMASIAIMGAIMMSPLGTGVLVGAAALLIVAGSLYILGQALQGIAKGFGALGLIQPILSGLVGMIGGIFALSAAFATLAGSLGLLGLAGIAALPALLGLAAAGAGLGMLFGVFSDGGENSGLEEGGENLQQQMVNHLKNILEETKKGRVLKVDNEVLARVVGSVTEQQGGNTGTYSGKPT